jgi:exonuclease VII large subunit
MLTANDLVKQTRPKQSGAEDGANDFPPTNAAPYASRTEQDIHSLCQEEVTDQHGAFVRAITQARNQISSIRRSLPTDIKTKAVALVNAFRSALVEHSHAIRQAADEVERRAFAPI